MQFYPEQLETSSLAVSGDCMLPDAASLSKEEGTKSPHARRSSGLCALQLDRLSHRMNARRSVVSEMIDKDPNAFHRKHVADDAANARRFLDLSGAYKMHFNERKGMWVPRTFRGGFYSNPTTFPPPNSLRHSSSPSLPLGSSFSDSLSSSGISNRSRRSSLLSSTLQGSVSSRFSSHTSAQSTSLTASSSSASAIFSDGLSQRSSRSRPSSASRSKRTVSISGTKLNYRENLDADGDTVVVQDDDSYAELSSRRLPSPTSSAIMPVLPTLVGQRPTLAATLAIGIKRLPQPVRTGGSKTHLPKPVGPTFSVDRLSDPRWQMEELDAFEQRLNSHFKN
eukprot:ANDGO_00185.mRNA.1 hypothetical protein